MLGLRVFIRSCRLSVVVLICWRAAIADEPLYRFEGDMLPTDAGWIAANACDGACAESVEDGYFLTTYEVGGDQHYYDRVITRPPEPQPVSLWLEWGFRSNQPMPPTAYTCDAFLTLWFQNVFQSVYFLGDAIVHGSGDFFVVGLDIDTVHTYRFESYDGLRYRFCVDGLILIDREDDPGVGSNYVQFGAKAGCRVEDLPKINRWDFIRYGTIEYGEEIVSTGPAQGFIDAREHSMLDRFTVRFAEANYVYVGEVMVETTPLTSPLMPSPYPLPGGEGTDPALALGALTTPQVIATRRLDNGPPEVVEVVLDRAIAYNATTRFTFDDGTIVQSVEFTYALGDTDGDGDADLADFAWLQNCFGMTVGEAQPTSLECRIFDVDENSVIDLVDYIAFRTALGF